MCMALEGRSLGERSTHPFLDHNFPVVEKVGRSGRWWTTKSLVVEEGAKLYLTMIKMGIIIIISLQVLVEKADVIGEPKNYDAGNPIPQNRPGQPSGPNQHGLSIDNVQHHGGSRASGPDAGQHAFGGSSFPRQESVMNNQSYSGSFAAGSLPGRNTSNSNHLPAKADPASGSFMESNQSGGLQPKKFPGSSGGGFQPPGNSYVRPAQPAFQQPAPMPKPLILNMGDQSQHCECHRTHEHSAEDYTRLEDKIVRLARQGILRRSLYMKFLKGKAIASGAYTKTECRHRVDSCNVGLLFC
ncbi:hypothetical protein KSP40_PGU010262 [Platanthera guangdongensis]|uniref:Uncharacterized protein n=1 Tax=Platanthera guangdongensis TaxID=2320717 RepID=A0ABR2LWI1_9ASPA